MSWPEALELLSAELGEPLTFRVAAERQFLERLIGAGVPAGTAELLITREWSILAGENDYTTDTFQQITGRHPRPVAEFLHEHHTEFVQCPRARIVLGRGPIGLPRTWLEQPHPRLRGSSVVGISGRSAARPG